jgi:hypothetical protein
MGGVGLNIKLYLLYTFILHTCSCCGEDNPGAALCQQDLPAGPSNGRSFCTAESPTRGSFHASLIIPVILLNCVLTRVEKTLDLIFKFMSSQAYGTTAAVKHMLFHAYT